MDLYTIYFGTDCLRSEVFCGIEDEIPEGMDEYCKQNGISVNELKIDMLTFYAEENKIRDQWLEEIEKRKKKSKESNDD